MPIYRVAVERTYTDVTVHYVDANTESEAEEKARAESIQEPPATLFNQMLQVAVIEMEEQEDVSSSE